MGFLDIFGKEKVKLSSKALPNHIALSLGDPCCEKLQESIKNSIEACVKLNIPMITFQLTNLESQEDAVVNVISLFSELSEWGVIVENKVKVSVLGKWYALPSRIIMPIKKLIDTTKDYDSFFVNFCINYNGQEEILDACKLVARHVQLNKLDPENITKSIIKDNLYSSYFLPPDVLIKVGDDKRLGGFLLWDSVNAKIYYSDKSQKDFKTRDLLEVISWWQNE